MAVPYPTSLPLLLLPLQSVRGAQSTLTSQKNAIIKDFAPEKKVRAGSHHVDIRQAQLPCMTAATAVGRVAMCSRELGRAGACCDSGSAADCLTD